MTAAVMQCMKANLRKMLQLVGGLSLYQSLLQVLRTYVGTQC